MDNDIVTINNGIANREDEQNHFVSTITSAIVNGIPPEAWGRSKEINVAISFGGGRYIKGDTSFEFDEFDVGLNIVPNA